MMPMMKEEDVQKQNKEREEKFKVYSLSYAHAGNTNSLLTQQRTACVLLIQTTNQTKLTPASRLFPCYRLAPTA